MANPSQVKAGLNDIATTIRDVRSRSITCKSQIAAMYSQLNNLTTQFQDVISTIDGYVPDNEFEALAKAERTVLTAEFVSLRQKLNQAQTALSAIDFAT